MKALLRNLWFTLFASWLRRRYFKPADLKQIELAIRQSEANHSGEIAVVIECARPLSEVLKKIPIRQRAEKFFALERVWDTEANCGVLIYVLLSEHSLEIIADRGIARVVVPSVWQQMLYQIEPLMRQHQGLMAILKLIEQIDQLLRRHFPPHPQDRNEIKDAPTVL